MRLLADENFPAPIIRVLRQRGHDVRSVKEQLPGISDEQVLRWANEQQRVHATFDKDFGELAVRFAASIVGVVLFRLSGDSPEEDSARVVQALEGIDDCAGHFSVVTTGRVRQRLLRRK